MEMTFDQYIQNPMGIANSVISNREMYRNLYTNKLDTIMVREAGKVTYHLYKAKKKFFAYIKIPSETVKDFYYDVLIEFSPPKDESIVKRPSLKEYNVRFYSNDPSFVFTFAHAFLENDMFIKEYKDKMSKEAVKKLAVVKNPMNQVGYVKSLYFAYLIMTRYGLFTKLKYTERYDEKYLKRVIENADIKISKRTEAARKVAKDKRRNKNELSKLSDRRNIIHPGAEDTKRPGLRNKISITPTVKKSGGNIKTTRTVKRIKKR